MNDEIEAKKRARKANIRIVSVSICMVWAVALTIKFGNAEPLHSAFMATFGAIVGFGISML